MNGRVPRILFVSHSASRNGATILLLHLLQWLRRNTDYRLEVLMNGTGALLPDFRKVCETRVWRAPGRVLNTLPGRWRRSLEPWVDSHSLRLWLAGRRYDLVYFNTAVAAAKFSAAADYAGAVLWHIHELEYALRLAAGEASIDKLVKLANRFISVSGPVSSTLVDRFHVRPEQIDLVHGFVPAPPQAPEQAGAICREVRCRLGWPEDAFVVGGCGALGWRKGTDIFLQLAREMSGGRTRFLWVGGKPGDDATLQFEYDLHMFGLEDRCALVPTTSSVLEYYLAMDVFALTSREDPFPLVMLEAAACNLPVVCFDSAGGGPEFVTGGAGLTAPYLDMKTFACQIEKLRLAPELRQQLGSAAAAKVRALHSVDMQGPKVLDSINRCLAAGAF
ncbi:MAG: glycosyltransferase family 4 protein [Acidobacteriota bacterium]